VCIVFGTSTLGLGIISPVVTLTNLVSTDLARKLHTTRALASLEGNVTWAHAVETAAAHVAQVGIGLRVAGITVTWTVAVKAVSIAVTGALLVAREVLSSQTSSGVRAAGIS
jgi:hypothetical protein